MSGEIFAIIDIICQDPLGFYLFMNFVSLSGDAIYANFLTDVAEYRMSSSDFRLEVACDIISNYLLSNYISKVSIRFLFYSLSS